MIGLLKAARWRAVESRLRNKRPGCHAPCQNPPILSAETLYKGQGVYLRRPSTLAKSSGGNVYLTSGAPCSDWTLRPTVGVTKGLNPPGPRRKVHVLPGFGGIAQLVERLVRNEKAWGSNPHTSTS